MGVRALWTLACLVQALALAGLWAVATFLPTKRHVVGGSLTLIALLGAWSCERPALSLLQLPVHCSLSRRPAMLPLLLSSSPPPPSPLGG